MEEIIKEKNVTTKVVVFIFQIPCGGEEDVVPKLRWKKEAEGLLCYFNLWLCLADLWREDCFSFRSVRCDLPTRLIPLT